MSRGRAARWEHGPAADLAVDEDFPVAIIDVNATRKFACQIAGLASARLEKCVFPQRAQNSFVTRGVAETSADGVTTCVTISCILIMRSWDYGRHPVKVRVPQGWIYAETEDLATGSGG